MKDWLTTASVPVINKFVEFLSFLPTSYSKTILKVMSSEMDPAESRLIQ